MNNQRNNFRSKIISIPS